MSYNKYSNINYKINTMRIATDLYAEVIGLIDEYNKYNKYKKEIVLNSSKLRDLVTEKPHVHYDVHYDVDHESIIPMLMYQNELNSFVPTLQEKIEEYQKSSNDIKVFEEFISDEKDILKNMLKLAPKISLDEIVNLNNYLENKGLDEDNISDIKAKIEGYKEYIKSLLKENSELKVYFEQAGISLQDKNVNILNVVEFTTNDILEQLTSSLAGFKALDAHTINDAAIKVGLIKPFMPMVPQVN